MREGSTGLALLCEGLPLNLISKYRNALFGVAILGILISHTRQFGLLFPALGRNNIFQLLVSYGVVGVDMFLFLSGMGLFYSFSKDEKAYPFIKRRLSRILPAVFIICGVIWGIRTLGVHNNIPAFLARITLLRFWLKGAHQIWYVNLILLLYLLYPYLYHYLFDKEEGALRRCIFLIVGVLLFNYALQVAYPEFWAWTRIAFTRIPVFVFGCYFGKLVYERRRLPAQWIFVFALGLIAAFLLRFYMHEPFTIADSHDTLLHLLLGVGAVCICYVLTTVFELVSSLKASKAVFVFLNLFGVLSLEIFLSHIILRDEVYKKYFMKGSGRIREYLVVVLVSIVVAAAVHYAIEKWSQVYQKLKNRRRSPERDIGVTEDV